MELTYGYKAGSVLPRRAFVVDATVSWNDNTVTNVQYNVTAPDFGAAEGVVRRLLTEALSVDSFRMDMVREVTYGWNAERGDYSAVVVTVPFLYRPVVNHR